MTEASTNPQWQRFADLKPKLHPHLHIHRHTYRGERWYVLQEPTNGRFLRFNGTAYEFIARLNGHLTLKTILEDLHLALGDSAPSQSELIHILFQLSQAELVRGGVPAEIGASIRRAKKPQAGPWSKALLNPLSIRIPLFDPDALLTRLAVFAQVLLSPVIIAAWVALSGVAVSAAIAYSGELSAALQNQFLKPDNLALIVVLYTLVKAFHEFGHGVALKIWGGRVREMGITLLCFIPVPYVDGSDAWSFPDKRKRAAVAAAGVLTELTLAGLALAVWLWVEPGRVQDVALQVMLIGGLSTLLFNGNPLLRFDGYYVFEDLIEIPNLATRANQYYVYLVQRYLFGLSSALSPVSAQGERIWFVTYGFASFIYRTVLLFLIALYLAEEYLVVGVVLAVWSLATQALLPFARGLRFVATSQRLATVRVRAAAVSAGFSIALIAFTAGVPMPLKTTTQGYIWLPEQGQVFAENEGFVEEVLVAEGSRVTKETRLLLLSNPELARRMEGLQGRLRELEAQRSAQRQADRVYASITDEEIATVRQELVILKDQQAKLLIKSPGDGAFISPAGRNLVGRFIKKGEVVAYIVGENQLIVRTVVEQDGIGRVRSGVRDVQIRLADNPHRVLKAKVLREVPGGSMQLPYRMLGASGGGLIAVDPTDPSGLKTYDRIFQVDLSLPSDFASKTLGGRAYVRFEHGSEPLAFQWARALRQVFLSRLQV